MNKACWLTVAVLLLAGSGWTQDEVQKKLEDRIAVLEKKVADLEQVLEPLRQEMQVRERREKLARLAQARMKQDLDTFTKEQMEDIERLYQVANQKWNTTEAMDSLMKLMKEYPKANRTGCGVLYLAQMSDDAMEQEILLKRAIKDHSDCWYGDGVQVGAYARFLLAHLYARGGKAEEAKKLVAEVSKDFPDSINHNGQLLSEILPQENAEK